MAGKNTAKRTVDPIKQRRRDFEAVGLSGDCAVLEANADLAVERAERESKDRKAHLDRARRMDAFEALREGMTPGAYDAARRLERDITVRNGDHDQGRPMFRVDEERATDRTDAMLAAGERVDAALAGIGGRDAFLLTELIAPSRTTALAATTWRGVVAYVTGEENDRGQAAIVRHACANLAASYNKMLRAA